MFQRNLYYFILCILTIFCLSSGCFQKSGTTPSITNLTGSPESPEQSPVISITPAENTLLITDNPVPVLTMTPAATAIVLDKGRIAWQPNTVASNMVFGTSITATISGRDYLILSVNVVRITNVNGPGTNADAGILILDVSNAENPTEVAYLKNGLDGLFYDVNNIKLYGSKLYATTRDRFWIIDLADVYHPAIVGKTEPAGSYIRDMEVIGDHAYLAFENEIRTLDISDLSQPRFTGEAAPANYVGVLKSNGSLLYGLSQDKLYIFEASVAGPLKELSSLTYPFTKPTFFAPEFIPPSFFDMELNNKYVYITAGINKLLVVDISNPAAPRIVTDLNTKNQGVYVRIWEKHVYLLSAAEEISFSMYKFNVLEIIDITDPEKPIELDPLDLNSKKFTNSRWQSFVDFTLANEHIYVIYKEIPLIEIIDLKAIADNPIKK